MTFHRYDPASCGGGPGRRTLFTAIGAGFLIGLGAGSLGALWLSTGPADPIVTAAVQAEAPAAHPAWSGKAAPVRHAQFVRESSTDH